MSRPPSDFTVLEQICDALVQALDGLEELVNSDGFGGYFMDSQVRQYCFAELSGAANALGGATGALSADRAFAVGAPAIPELPTQFCARNRRRRGALSVCEALRRQTSSS